MNGIDAIGVTAIFALLVTLVVILRQWQVRRAPAPEVVRKSLHMAMGVATLSFPWLFNSAWAVVALAVLSALFLTAIERLPRWRDSLGQVVAGVQRRSWGTLFFALAVALVFAMSDGDPLLYCVPVAMLTFGDSLAALVGHRFGMVKFQTGEGRKSWEGAGAMFAVTFLVVLAGLLLWPPAGMNWLEKLLAALMMGLVGMVVEAVSWRGLDNLFLPLLGHVFLKTFLELEAAGLGMRLAVLVALLFFTVRQRAQQFVLRDNARIGAALFLYVAFAVGGWQWFLPPLTLLLLYARFIPFNYDVEKNKYSFEAVLAVVGPGLVWLLLYRAWPVDEFFLPYLFAFAASLAVIWLARIKHNGQPKDGGAAFVRAALPPAGLMLAVMSWLLRDEARLGWVLGAAVGALLFACGAVWWRRDGEYQEDTREWDWACCGGWVLAGSALVYGALAGF
jgi:phytol kinase